MIKSPENWVHIKKNWLLQIIPKIIYVLLLLSVTLIAIQWNKLPPLLPLWFSRPWGIDQLAARAMLLILPAGALMLFALNTFLGIYFSAEYLIFTQALYLTSLLVNIMSFIAVVKILFLVL